MASKSPDQNGLSEQQRNVLRNKGTEPAFSGEYLNHDKPGVYKCVSCGAELFTSSHKYESTIPGLMGWPSFADVASSGAVELKDDNSLGMKRTEVVCKKCGGHLGHLFNDPSSPTEKHYCINSCVLNFKPKEQK
jgi:peptide-methionine (R)-S-oxide reductase